MELTTDRATLERLLAFVRANPSDAAAKGELIVYIRPVVSAIAEEYSASEAGRQEMIAAINQRLALRADDMARRWFDSRLFLIREVLGAAYLAVVDLDKKASLEPGLLDAGDPKLSLLVNARLNGKRRALLHAYGRVCARIKAAYDKERDRRLAERSLRILMHNLRPKWEKVIAERWGRARLRRIQLIFSLTQFFARREAAAMYCKE